MNKNRKGFMAFGAVAGIALILISGLLIYSVAPIVYAVVNYPYAAGLQTGDVKTGHILDGTILNADVSASAAIAWSKLNTASGTLADIGTRAISDTTGTLAITRGGTGQIATGTANQIWGYNSGATDTEWKTLTAGAGIVITHATNSVTFVGGGSDPIYGDGSDGEVTLTASTTLTLDKFYNNLTVNSGVVLNTGGFRVFVNEALTNNGTIHYNGNAGGAGGNGSGATGGAAGTAGGALSGGTICGAVSGPAGKAGGSSGAGGTAGTAGTAQTGVSGNGGAGGNGGGGGANGGSGGTTTALKIIRDLTTAVLGRSFGAATSTTWTLINSGGSGGSGGSGNGGDGSSSGGGSGGGGGAGGCVLVAAKTVSGTGTISANGGNGGAGGNAGGTVGGGGAGSGGGAGGMVWFVYQTNTGTQTVTASGGTKGAAGSPVGGGGSPTAAVDGGAGVVVTLSP